MDKKKINFTDFMSRLKSAFPFKKSAAFLVFSTESENGKECDSVIVGKGSNIVDLLAKLMIEDENIFNMVKLAVEVAFVIKFKEDTELLKSRQEGKVAKA